MTQLVVPARTLNKPLEDLAKVTDTFHAWQRLIPSPPAGEGQGEGETMEAAGLAPPLFESDRGQNQFVTQFLFHHFVGEDDIRWLARFKDLNLTDEEARALIVSREAGTIDNATYRALNKVDPLAASTTLRRLRDAGLLKQEGRVSATYYQPTDKLIGTQDVEQPGLSSNGA